MMFVLIGWYPQWHGIYGLFPTEELAQLVALRLTPSDSLYDGRILWRHEHKTSYSGTIANRFNLMDKEIVSWSIQKASDFIAFVDESALEPKEAQA